jgi:HK97 family phage prohead protease
MEIRIKNDAVEIDGYVNAVERASKPLWSRLGQFVERICKGAFAKALKRNDNVRILLNHDPQRDLGGQKDGNLELEEDNIGLRARATITDPDVVKKARQGDLVGWSFGFYDRDVENKRDENGLPLRDVKDLDLVEVSLLDRSAIPAYDGTLVCVRSESETVFYGESMMDELHIREEQSEEVPDQPKETEVAENKVNYDEIDRLIEDMKN